MRDALCDLRKGDQMSSTTYSLRPCVVCRQLPRFCYRSMPSGPVVELRCPCVGVHAQSDSIAAATWNAMNSPPEKSRE